MDVVGSNLAIGAAEADLREEWWGLMGCLVVMVRAFSRGVDANE